MDQQEQVAILEQLARDPGVTARERVGALRLLREIAEEMPPKGGELTMIEQYMERGDRGRYESK